MNDVCLVHSVLMRFFSFFRLGLDRVEKKGSRKASLHYNRYSAKAIAIFLMLVFSVFSTVVLQLGNILIPVLIFIPLFLTASLLSMTAISIDLDFSSKKILSNLHLAGNTISTCSIGLVQRKDIKIFKVKKIIRKPREKQKQLIHKLIVNNEDRRTTILISGDLCLTVLLKFFQETNKL